ncbi:hypothetical protein F5884DRAFT_138993 [Xylogone sp. PMI_703]|nr:hypothetical protein F5884DRAFT_138993 [Xylogone sp. PMI_703]
MPTGQMALRLVVQPSSNSYVGVRLWPPLIGILSDSSSSCVINKLSQIIAVVTIIDESSGRAYYPQEGNFSDSPHPLGEDALNITTESQRDVAYIHFPYLIVSTPGRYIIRVSLAQRTDGGVYEYISSVDSRTVAVSYGRVDVFDPTPEEPKLERLLGD